MGILAFGRRAKISGKLPYQEFYRQSVQPLAAHFRRLGVRNQEDLEDLIQETYVQAFKSWDNLADPQAALAWLMTIGRRQYAKGIERKKRLPQDLSVSLVEEEGSELQATATPLGSDGDTLQIQNMEQRSQCDLLRALVATIKDDKRRRAIELFYFFEYSLPEITAETGINSSTLTTWCSRFRKEANRIIFGPAIGKAGENLKKPNDRRGILAAPRMQEAETRTNAPDTGVTASLKARRSAT